MAEMRNTKRDVIWLVWIVVLAIINTAIIMIRRRIKL